MTECPICLEGCETCSIYCKTTCNHRFHYSCLETWGLKSSCPLCRAEINSVDLEVFKMDIDGLNKKLSFFDKAKMKAKVIGRKTKKVTGILKKVFFGSIPSRIGTASLLVAIGSLVVLGLGVISGTFCIVIFGASVASAIFYLCGGVGQQMIEGTF